MSWDYVALGDSVPFGSGDVAGHSFVFMYADFIEQDTGVRVRVHNLASDGGTSSDLFAQVKGNAPMRQALKHADVITISIGGNDLESQIGSFAAHTCGGPDNQQCLRHGLASFERAWPELLDSVLLLRRPQESIIRVTNDYNPFPGNDQATSNLGKAVGPVFTSYLRRLNAYRCKVAKRDRIPCADVALMFNGPNEDRSAFAKGLIGTDQFAHPSAKGHRLIARILRELGYHPLR